MWLALVPSLVPPDFSKPSWGKYSRALNTTGYDLGGARVPLGTTEPRHNDILVLSYGTHRQVAKNFWQEASGLLSTAWRVKK